MEIKKIRKKHYVECFFYIQNINMLLFHVGFTMLWKHWMWGKHWRIFFGRKLLFCNVYTIELLKNHYFTEISRVFTFQRQKMFCLGIINDSSWCGQIRILFYLFLFKFLNIQFKNFWDLLLLLSKRSRFDKHFLKH